MQGPVTPANFFSAPGPMVCFTSVAHEETFINLTGCVPYATEVIYNCNVTMCGKPTIGRTTGLHIIYTALIRVPGRVTAFLQKVDQFSNVFTGNVVIADPKMSAQAFRINRIPYKDNYFTINNARELSVILDMPMADYQLQGIQDGIFAFRGGQQQQRQRPNVPADWMPPQMLRQTRNVDQFYNSFRNEANRRGMAAPPPPPPDLMRGSGMVFHNGPGTVVGSQGAQGPFDIEEISDMFGNDDIQTMHRLVQRAMEQSHHTASRGRAARREAVARDAVPLPMGWGNVLKQAEPAIPGYPECRICCANKATILFVECGHLIACDYCVKRMFTDPEVPSECPLCPGVKKTKILRPVMSEVTPIEQDTDLVDDKNNNNNNNKATSSLSPPGIKRRKISKRKAKRKTSTKKKK